MVESADFLVIGGGIAGASAAYHLVDHGRVIILEREAQPGYHTTGRSAALYTEGYGNRVIRAITTASRAFLMEPPDGFASDPVLSPRGTLLLARADQTSKLAAAKAEIEELVPSLEMVEGERLRALCPVIEPAVIVQGLYEPDAMDMDVHALLHGFLRGARARGARLETDSELVTLAREDGAWAAATRDGRRFSASVVVNAAGAWADAVARLAGARPVGLVPKRRTAFTFAAPPDLDTMLMPAVGEVAPMPAVIDIDESWYIKPEAGRLLGSPADETPSEPCDAQPEELDLAVAVDRIEQSTTLRIRRLLSKWAGLRSFVADKTPVVGPAPEAPGFFWLAGQGGYGIQTCPAMGRIAAALATGGAMPADLARLGVTAADLAPDRRTLA